jgi:hypothetical protein
MIKIPLKLRTHGVPSGEIRDISIWQEELTLVVFGIQMLSSIDLIITIYNPHLIIAYFFYKNIGFL